MEKGTGRERNDAFFSAHFILHPIVANSEAIIIQELRCSSLPNVDRIPLGGWILAAAIIPSFSYRYEFLSLATSAARLIEKEMVAIGPEQLRQGKIQCFGRA